MGAESDDVLLADLVHQLLALVSRDRYDHYKTIMKSLVPTLEHPTDPEALLFWFIILFVRVL